MDHILGGIYGQALGDAFCMPSWPTRAQTLMRFAGAPVEFLTPDPAHEVHHGLRAGQFTDDTEQAMFLATRFIADGRVTSEGAAQAIVTWYDAVDGDNVVFVGPSSRRAVARIKSGVDLQLTGVGGDTNGSAMRASVVGLIHPGDPEAAARDAVLSAMPTHNTGVGCAAAAAVASAVAAALTPGVALREVIMAGIAGAQTGEALGRPWLGASVARRIEFAVSLARDQHGADADRLQAIYDLVGTSLAASEAIPAAFGIVALADGDPLRAAQLAFMLSGDADTIGAMACAISGAYAGLGAIPEALCQTLRAANPAYDLDMAAHGLHGLAQNRISETTSG